MAVNSVRIKWVRVIFAIGLDSRLSCFAFVRGICILRLVRYLIRGRFQRLGEMRLIKLISMVL